MLGERLCKRTTALDIRLDVKDEFLHGRVFVAITDDLECLHKRDARREHRGELTTEQRNITGCDLATTGKQALTLLADTSRNHALSP